TFTSLWRHMLYLFQANEDCKIIFNVGGMMPSLIAKIVKAASRLPAAPSR
ncbi:hypothetical protein ALC53_09635, partial [Atta colombica]